MKTMQHIGNRYEIQHELGEGSMGTVYQGLDTQTGETVAIKELKSHLTSPDQLERFQREGEALRALKHPNIVQLLDTIKEDQQHYLVMEYVAGGDLSHKLKNGPLPVTELLSLAIDLCDALTRAHKLDVIHRDLKPANILIAEDGTVRLTDFGVAYMGGKHRMTNTGSIIGTIDYIAPEVIENQVVDKRADIWAVGVILFEMLVGRSPFAGTSLPNVLHNILSADIPDLEELCPDAPLGLVDLIYRILNRNPAERIPSIRLIGAALEALTYETPLPMSSANSDIGATFQMDVQTFRFNVTPIAVQSVKNNLPVPNTPFVGRENDLTAITNFLQASQNRLITIIAQGGMGKTRLAIEAATNCVEDFPHGAFFVELAPLTNPDDIPSAIAEAIRYPFQDGHSPQAQIASYFSNKECLLVLDNFEHLLAGRDLIQAILETAPQITILATSREHLNLSAEILYHLEGMDFPRYESPTDATEYAAVRLFANSAKRLRSDFSLEAEHLPYVIRICRLVHGLPLGIILAATWLDTLSLQEIADEIASNIDFLDTTMHDIPERQRSLRAVFEYSWKMLSDDEKDAFSRLAVFRGGMRREAIQAVADTKLRTLQTLVNKSLLRRDAATGRYEIHELLRQYAEEYLHESGLFENICAKHAVYYAQFTASLTNSLKEHNQLAGLTSFDEDLENIKVAWRYACHNEDAETIDFMLEPVFWYCTFRNRNMEGRELFQMARERWQDDSLLAGRLLLGYPLPLPDYTDYYERSIQIIKQHTSGLELAYATHRLGHWLSHSLGNHERGIQLMEESAVLYENIGEKFYLGVVLDDIGWSYRSIGQVENQRLRVERSIDIRRAIGDKIGMANALRNLGGALGGMGAGAPEVLDKWQEALSLSQEIGDKRNIAWNSYMLSAYWQFDGDQEKSLPYRSQAAELATEIKEETVYNLCLLSDAIDLILYNADLIAAQHLIDQAYPPSAQRDFRQVIAGVAICFLRFVEQDWPKLKIYVLEMYTVFQQFSHTFINFIPLLSIPFLVRDTKYERAVEYYGYLRITPLNRLLKTGVWFENYWADVESRLDNATYQSNLERGSQRKTESIVEEAMDYVRNC